MGTGVVCSRGRTEMRVPCNEGNLGLPKGKISAPAPGPRSGPGRHLPSQWSGGARLPSRGTSGLQDLCPSASPGRSASICLPYTAHFQACCPWKEPLESLLVCWIFLESTCSSENAKALVRGFLLLAPWLRGEMDDFSTLPYLLRAAL